MYDEVAKLGLKVDDFTVEDNTCYPRTLDPTITQTGPVEPGFMMVSRQLPKSGKTHDGGLLEAEILLFEKDALDRQKKGEPLEGQLSTDYSLMVNLKLRQIRIVYLQAMTLRLLDYIL
jgi:hypothetical protein